MSDIFKRLAKAAKAADELPAIISEINALLPDGWEVRRCDVEPVEIIDWRDWQVGDIAVCTDDCNQTWWTRGKEYPVVLSASGTPCVIDDVGSCRTAKYIGGTVNFTIRRGAAK